VNTGGNGAHMSGGQGAASSNLASPTAFVLVRAIFGLTGPVGSGSVSREFHRTPARATPSPLAAVRAPRSVLGA
jgi:hypothetical protein